MPEPNLKHISVKKLIRKNKNAGPFGGKYAFSPYMACAHACRYCDGRSERYYVEGDFDHDIVIRENAPELLRAELPKLREWGPICISSGVSDPYQPIERDKRLMRRCAEILTESRFPIIIHTKSALALDDLDLWHKLHQKAPVCLMVSLTFLDDSLRRVFEPGASPVSERLRMLSEFKQRGLLTGVLAMPFIPGISDSEQAITDLFAALKKIAVDFIMPGGLTLKPGRQKETFLATIANHFPQQLDQMTDLYGSNDFYGSPPKPYYRRFIKQVKQIAAASGLPVEIPHALYRRQFTNYDVVQILLGHMMTLYRDKGISVAPLQNARQCYAQWLQSRRHYYARRRNLSYRGLEAELVEMAESDRLAEVLGNRKLSRFLTQIILANKVLDYTTLQLIDRVFQD